MIDKKRGMLVIVVFLLIVSSGIVLSHDVSYEYEECDGFLFGWFETCKTIVTDPVHYCFHNPSDRGCGVEAINVQAYLACDEKKEGEVIEREIGEETVKGICLPVPHDTPAAKFHHPLKWYSFESLADTDEDGAPDQFDCLPENDNVWGSYPPNCKDDEEIECLVEATDEICGNGIDDDCSGWNKGLPVYGIDDDCDLEENKEACKSNCLDSGNSCDWALNAVSGENYCCGDDGVEDLAETISAESGDYLCVGRDYAEVDTAESVDKVGSTWELKTSEGEKASGCDDWCWIKSDGDAKFNIYTINEPEKTYDVVSDGSEWHVCDMEKSLLDDSTNDGVTKSDAAKFYCYQEGEDWSWAECAPFASINNKKARFAGDGLYSLYLEDAKTEEIVDKNGVKSTVKIVDNENGENIVIGSKGEFMDFTGYDQLNLFVRFDEEGLTLPVELKLKISGPEVGDNPIVYFNQNVLSHAINLPLFEGWTHIQIPIPDNLDLVSTVSITSITEITDKNKIEVKNVYLDKSTKDSMICSGVLSGSGSNWLTSFDEGNPKSTLTSQKMCEEHYGENAWLGDDVEVDKTATNANCCGNEKSEYYAGFSKEGYGCWNSQVVAPNEDIMNVEFNVNEYFEKEYVSEFIPAQFTATLNVEGPGNIYCNNVYNFDSNYPGDKRQCNKRVKEMGTNNGAFILDLDRPTYLTYIGVGFNSESGKIEAYNGGVKVGESSNSQILNLDLLEVDKIIVKKSGPFDINFIELVTKFEEKLQNQEISEKEKVIYEKDFSVNLDAKLEVTSNNEFVDVVFLNEDTTMSKSDIKGSNGKVKMIARSKQLKSEESTQKKSTTLNYPCTDSQCVFPLPGEPSYIITNPNPHLYDLYFVGPDTGKEGILITPQNNKFETVGNILVKKIAQQIIHINNEDRQEFYGCQAANFAIQDVPYITNLNYCEIRGDKFCSYSVDNEGFTTINSWSGSPLESVGYEEPSELPEDLSQLNLKLKLLGEEGIIPAAKRNTSAPMLPGKNFLPNAEFVVESKRLLGWQLFNPDGTTKDVKKKDVELGILTLLSGESLISERIAVSQETTLHFSQAAVCGNTNILLVDKNGAVTNAILPQFSTETASYLRIEFNGPCEIEKPMLQLVDEGKIAKYSFNPIDELQRAGAACCPRDYCWNGYSCVEPMVPGTYLIEHVGDGQDYRCVAGEWTAAPIKKDWFQDKWGFCSNEKQCFVVPSEDATADATYENFVDGEIPSCINDKEYIYDHYCDQGNWTTRTKFVAKELLKTVEEDDEYILYCTTPQEALISLDYQDKFILGEVAEIIQTDESSLFAGEPGQKQETACLTLPENARKLISKEENTCVNNVCLLLHEDEPVAFATSLNKDTTDNIDSFLNVFGVSPESVTDSCTGTGDFVECDFIDFNENIYYSPELNAIIYSKEELAFGETFFGKVKTFFKEFLGLEDEFAKKHKEFVNDVQNFRNLYLLNKGDKKVRAVKEIISDKKQTLVAEYEGFDTPVCEYVRNIEVPSISELGVFGQLLGKDKIVCTHENGTQKVVAIEGINYLWPMMTGKLRVGEVLVED